jgi:fatty acid desaturase
MTAVEQDGVGTDEHVRAASWLARLEPTRAESRIVLRTLLVADVGLLVVIGALFALFMQCPAGFVFAGCCWTLAALLTSASCMAHRLSRRGERRR